MIDADTNARNLASAENVARANLGLQDSEVADWSQDEFLEYIKELAAIINAHPTEFSDESLASAAVVLAQRNMQTSDFLDDQVQNLNTAKYALGNAISAAGDNVASLGNGVLNALGNVGKVLDKGSAAAASAASVSDLLVPGIAIVLFVWLIKDPVRATSAGRNIAGGVRELAPY